MITLATVIVVGVAALVVRGLTTERSFGQTLGVTPVISVATLHPGDMACQKPIALAEKTSLVTFNPGTPHAEPGPRIEVAMRAAGTDRVLSSGAIPRGFDPRVAQTARIAPVPADTRVDVCFRNADSRGTALLFGDSAENAASVHATAAHATISTSAATLNGKDLPGDIAIVFPYAHPPTKLSLIPTMFERASLWRPSWMGPGVYWVLLALIVCGCPVLLGGALLSATRSDPS